jgi:MFS family permease
MQPSANWIRGRSTSIIEEVSGRVAFQYPNFRYFMMARFLATLSSEMQAIAVGWQVYGLTHRPLDLGLVGLAQFLPGVLLFLVSGQAADRFPRRRIVMACYAGFAACSLALLALTLVHNRQVWPIYAVLLGNGIVRSFNGAAGQSFLPSLIPAEYFPNAVAWSSSVFTGATILGPAIGGLLYGLTATPGPVYASAGAGCVCSLLLAAAIRVAVPPRKAATMRMVFEGLRFIRRKQLLLGVISLDLFAVLLGGATALLPAYADTILKIGPSGLGMLRSAPAMGALLMATLHAYRPLRRRAGAAMLWCVAGFGVFTVTFGLSRSVPISMASLILLGACDMVSVIVRHTMVQLSTPDEMRGRVSAVNMVFIGASNELGQFESGLTAQWFGVVPAVVIGGIGTMAVVAVWAWLFPHLRKVDELTSVKTKED